jgi:hypothetical protein
MALIWEAVDDIEPIADGTIAGIANIANYATISGCAQTYSLSDMVKTVAAGEVLHNGTVTAVAGNTVTLVADSLFARWTYTLVNSTGAAVIISGDPAAEPSVPEPGDRVIIGLDLVQAGQTIANDITYQIDKRVIVPTQEAIRYKTATQVFTADTTFADITASSGNMAFSIAAGETVQARFLLPVTVTGTGGLKLQLTGPAGPTLVRVDGVRPSVFNDGGGVVVNPSLLQVSATAFSSSIVAVDSGGTTNGNWVNGTVELDVLIVNGSTAGTVTLQGAQNSANGTTTFAIGCRMFVTRRMAA